MPIPAKLILVCASFRTTGSPQGVCQKKGAIALLPYLEEGLADRGIDAQVATTGCLKVCGSGPVLVVEPEHWWIGNVDEAAIDAVLDALAEGREPTGVTRLG